MYMWEGSPGWPGGCVCPTDPDWLGAWSPGSVSCSEQCPSRCCLLGPHWPVVQSRGWGRAALCAARPVAREEWETASLPWVTQKW